MLPRKNYDIGAAQQLLDLALTGTVGVADVKYLLPCVSKGVVQARPIGSNGRSTPARFMTFKFDTQNIRTEFGKHSRCQRAITVGEVDNSITIKERNHSLRTVAVGPFTLSFVSADWSAIAKRNSRSVQTIIGWIFWDPDAVERFAALGLPGPIGYIAARCAPLAPAGPDAVIAAFGSISPLAIRATFAMVEASTSFDDVWSSRNDAVLEGLAAHAPDLVPVLARDAETLWAIVDKLPTTGRTFFASHLRMERPSDPTLSGWHAINCIREWRGDTHWALATAQGLTGIEASILHNAWLGYDEGWLPTSRGSSPVEIAEGLVLLEEKGLAIDGRVNDAGLDLRQHLEDATDSQTIQPWQLLGETASARFAEEFEPPCELLLARVDETAGTNYQPASRQRGAGVDEGRPDSRFRD
ncbi:hypothetical protein MCETE4_00817 [Acidimicrobiia bacterium]